MTAAVLAIVLIAGAVLVVGRKLRNKPSAPSGSAVVSSAVAGNNIIAVSNSPGAQISTGSNSAWTEVTFDDQEDLRAALAGDALGPRNVVACPPIPEVEEIVARLRKNGAAAIVGESGSGKSMAAWHAAHRLHQDGWSVYILSNPNASSSPPNTTGKGLYIVDDAQSISALPVNSALATPERAVLVVSATDIPGFRNVVRVAPKRAVDAIAAAFTRRESELLPILKALDSRIGDRFLDTPVERQIEFARRSSETPWQFMFNLSSGELRLKHKLDAVRGSPPLDVVLFCIAVGQLASRGRPCSLPWLNSTVRDQTDGRINNAETLLGSLHSHLALLRTPEGVATPHARVAGVVLQAMFFGKEAGDQKRRELLWAVLQDTSFPIAGALWLIDQLPHHYRWHLPSEVAEALVRRCLHVSEKDRGDAGHVLGRLLGMLDAAPLLDEVSSTLSCWLRESSASDAAGIASALNSLINIDLRSEQKTRDPGGTSPTHATSKDTDQRAYAKETVGAVDPGEVAAKVNQATINELYFWAHLLGRIASSGNPEWGRKFAAALDETELLALCARCPAGDIGSVAELAHVMGSFSEDLSLRMTDAIVPSLAEALRKDLVGTFNEVRDLVWWTLRFGPKPFLRRKPDERRKEIAARLVREVGASSIVNAIANAKPRDWHVLGEVTPLVTRLAPDVGEEVADQLDVDSLVERLNGLAAESIGELDEALVTLYLTKDGRPASLIVDRICVPMNRMTLRAACMSPRAAMTVIRAGGKIDLELKGGLPRWDLALLGIASVYQQDQEAARMLLRSNLAQLADAFAYRQSNGGEGASRFIEGAQELDPAALTDAMHLVDVELAKQNWPQRAQGSPEERVVLAKILAIAKEAGGEHARIASTIACEPPTEIHAEAADHSDKDDDE